MRVSSLGFRTDLMLLALGGSTIQDAGDLQVIRTPSNPDFWWGNFVLAAGPEQLPIAVTTFAEAFPDAEHLAIGIDGIDGAPAIDASAAVLGLTVDRVAMLSTSEVRPPAHPNPEAEFRQLVSDDDFAQSAALQFVVAPENGLPFIQQRVAAWRALQDGGHGAWFGAFIDGVMRAGLGLFTDGQGLARYQAVDTHPDFRRQGLAGTLVHHAGREGLAWPGVHTLVIGADPHYHAIRIYRACGFAGTETQVQLLLPPPAFRDRGLST